MTPSPAPPVPHMIPQLVADCFLAALSSLVSIGREAVAAALPQGLAQASVWQKKIQPLLEARLSAAQAASTHFAIGRQQPLLAEALPLRFLARDTDGYALDFAGEAFATELTQRRRLVVLAAWQVCQAAGAA